MSENIIAETYNRSITNKWRGRKKELIQIDEELRKKNKKKNQQDNNATNNNNNKI